MAKTAAKEVKQSNMTAGTLNRVNEQLDDLADQLEVAGAAKARIVSKIRNARKQAQNEGVDLEVLDEIRAKRDAERSEVKAKETTRHQYAQILGIILVDEQYQMSFEVPEADLKRREEYDAMREGRKAGLRGDARNTNPFPPATIGWQAWDNGWNEGDTRVFNDSKVEAKDAATAPAAKEPKAAAAPKTPIKRTRPRKGDEAPELGAAKAVH